VNKHGNGITDAELKELVKTPSPHIVECGCHDGRDTERFLRLFPDCHVTCFEPDPRPLYRANPPGFIFRVTDGRRVTLVNAAVSDVCGVATLHRSSGKTKDWGDDYDHSSSLQRPTGHLEVHPWCTFPEEKRTKVLTVSLDSWLHVSEVVDLLWVDIQGGQRAFIRGAKRTLSQVPHLYIECHQNPLYEDEPTQEELVRLLEPLGLSPMAMYEGYNLLFLR